MFPEGGPGSVRLQVRGIKAGGGLEEGARARKGGAGSLPPGPGDASRVPRQRQRLKQEAGVAFPVLLCPGRRLRLSSSSLAHHRDPGPHVIKSAGRRGRAGSP